MNKLLKGILLITFLTGWFSFAYSNDKIIKVPTPPRPAGNTDLIGFSVAPIDTVRVGFVGLGMRGADAVERFTYVPGSKIEAICDLVTERVDSSISYLKRRNIDLPATYSGEEDSWKALCENPNVDLVYIATDWQHHVPIALYAMQNGKHVAIEVPSAFTLEDIWALVDTAETNRLHCTILENCVYDDFELNTLNMAQNGLFGEILHTEGSYIHNLEPYWDRYYNNWRLDYNSKHRGDLYPTHGAGPALQLLDIHRGDKMNILVSMDTKVAGVPLWLSKQGREVPADFKNGDHTMTMIKTENGKTIHIQHDVVNPRPYSRMYQLTGTNGFANKYPIEGYAFDGEQLAEDSIPDHENISYHKFVTDEQKKSLLEKYQHPILKEIGPKAKEVGGHGGMDYIMDYRLIYCLNNGLPLDMDVYDLAEWCAITPLSEISIENGSAPVEVPDFTRGAWNKVKGYRHAGVELKNATIILFDNSNSEIPYRIPAIAKTRNGDLVAVADYRYCKSDIGMVPNGKLDLLYRVQDSNTGVWQPEKTLAATVDDGTNFIAFGDPCIVADRESDRILVTSCSGNVSFPKGTHENHQGWARFYSEDGGQTWSNFEDISDQVFNLLDKRSDGPINSFFIGSGKITQSNIVKNGDFYRIYCAALVRVNDKKTRVNYVFYSDDFGKNWKLLGDVEDCPIPYGADEPKTEELPDGSILVSSRISGGRYYNVFHFNDINKGEGKWDTMAISNEETGGIKASTNPCNGETLCIPVRRNADGEETFLLLQSVPMNKKGERANVGINYKDLDPLKGNYTASNIASNWDGEYEVTPYSSAYSTMVMDKDNEIAFFYEENLYNDGFDLVLKRLSIEDITNGDYSFRKQ